MNKAELKQKFIDDYTPNDFDRLYPTEIEANKVFLKRLDELLQLSFDVDFLLEMSPQDIHNKYDKWKSKEKKKCPHCNSTNVIAWGPDADKCNDCKLTWDV